MLPFLLEVSQKDPRVLSDREQTLPLQSIPPGCDLDTFCCDYHEYKVLIMSHEVTEWLTSSSSATSLFFATSPIIASRRDKNLSCRQKFVFFTNRDRILNPSEVTYFYIIHFDYLIWYLATKLHKTLIDSPELEVISIVQRANLLNFVKSQKKTLSTRVLPSFIQGVIY